MASRSRYRPYSPSALYTAAEMELKKHLFVYVHYGFSERCIYRRATGTQVEEVDFVCDCFTYHRFDFVGRGVLYPIHAETRLADKLVAFRKLSLLLFEFLYDGFQQLTYPEMLRTGFFAFSATDAVGSLSAVCGMDCVVVACVPVVMELLCIQA